MLLEDDTRDEMRPTLEFLDELNAELARIGKFVWYQFEMDSEKYGDDKYRVEVDATLEQLEAWLDEL